MFHDKILCPGSPAPQLNWWREHALIDGSYENTDKHKTVNTILLENLQRTDLHSVLTCQASNNNISNPVSTPVKIDMHCRFSCKQSFVSSIFFSVGPLSVSLLNRKDSMSAGRRYEAMCQVVGARPAPAVTWWKGTQQMRDNITTTVRVKNNIRKPCAL